MSELRGQTCQGSGGKETLWSQPYAEGLPLKTQFKTKIPLADRDNRFCLICRGIFCTTLNQDFKAEEYGQ